MAKPAGPRCNLACVYCYYREKVGYLSESQSLAMSDEVLEAYVTGYLAAQSRPSVIFEWQGGEPTLMGLDFFRRAVELQRKHGRNRRIENSIQTNGTLIDAEWCAFFRENNFLVGLSLDGPAFVHDACRVDPDQRPTSHKVVRALDLLVKHGVEVNVVATVNRVSSQYPAEIYSFFKDKGVSFIQFIPVVESLEDSRPGAAQPQVTETSVLPQDFGRFMIKIFDLWRENDLGKTFVMNFEWILAAWSGRGSGVCYQSPTCGKNLILEHNGDLYSCDHFMSPPHNLGNILQTPLEKLVTSNQQVAFGLRKAETLPDACRHCDYLFACHGGCPKQRIAERGLNHLCEGLKAFYEHADPHLRRLVGALGLG